MEHGGKRLNCVGLLLANISNCSPNFPTSLQQLFPTSTSRPKDFMVDCTVFVERSSRSLRNNASWLFFNLKKQEVVNIKATCTVLRQIFGTWKFPFLLICFNFSFLWLTIIGRGWAKKHRDLSVAKKINYLPQANNWSARQSSIIVLSFDQQVWRHCA